MTEATTNFVWTVTQTEPVDTEDITTMYWRCEKFTVEGKDSEKIGVVSLNSPVMKSDFQEMSHEEVLALLFSCVSKDSVELEFNTNP